jgi:hypothetical protein
LFARIGLTDFPLCFGDQIPDRGVGLLIRDLILKGLETDDLGAQFLSSWHGGEPKNNVCDFPMTGSLDGSKLVAAMYL